MFIKHFREVTYRVPDPMRPGHSAFDRRMDASGAHQILHNGKEYQADNDGWFDVPDEVGAYFVGRPGWCTPEMVDEEKVAGRIRRDDAEPLPNTRAEIEKAARPAAAKAPRKRAQKKAASAS